MKVINKTKWLCYTALMTAITAVAAMVVEIPSVGGGYTNLSDAIIFMTAMLMDPVAAMIAGGLGTFLADLLIYPATMFYSLAFHGIEGLVVGLLIRLIPRSKGKVQYVLDTAYMLIGGALMIVGYYIAKRFFYGNAASALISLWRNCLQVVISIVVAFLLVYPLKLSRIVDRSSLYFQKGQPSLESSDPPSIEQDDASSIESSDPPFSEQDDRPSPESSDPPFSEQDDRPSPEQNDNIE